MTSIISNADVFHSQEIGSITEALVQFHRVCPKIPKDRRGARGKYADLSTVLDLVQPKLCECGLNVYQMPVGEYGLTTILSHISGEFIGSRYIMQPLEQTIDSTTKEKAITPQSLGAVITYQRRYAIGAILNLNIDDDTDADLPKEPEKPKPSAKDVLKSKQASAVASPADVAEATTKTVEPTTTTKLLNAGDGPTQESDNDPCSEQVQAEIKSALVQWEQVKSGVSADFKARLLASGRKKLAEFTSAEGRQLLESIRAKAITDFFEKQLQPKLNS